MLKIKYYKCYLRKNQFRVQNYKKFCKIARNVFFFFKKSYGNFLFFNFFMYELCYCCLYIRNKKREISRFLSAPPLGLEPRTP